MMRLSIFLLFLFLSISLIPISFLSIFNYYSSETQIINAELNDLDSTATLIESHLDLEIKKQILVLDLFTSRILLQTSLDNFNNEKEESDQILIQKIIDKAIESSPDLRTIYVLDNNEMVVASTNHLLVNQKYFDDGLFYKHDKSKIIDFNLEKNFGELKLIEHLFAPLFSDDNRKLGGIILEFDADDIFLSNHLIGLGNTGEYMIAKRDQNGDALFITPPRHISEKPLIHTVSKERIDVPIIQALLKNERTFDNKVDYRDEPVLSVTKYIEKMDWGLVVKIDKKEAFLPIENLRFFTLITVGITMVFSIFTSIIFSKSISTPINRIRRATKDIVNGKFTTQLSSGGRDEITELSNDINVMAESLEIQRELLRKEERLSAIGELAARISHDLKNPLSVLKISITNYMYRHEKDFDDMDKKSFQRMDKSILRISHQIEDVLNFVRTTSLKLEDAEISDILKNIVSLMVIPDEITINLPSNQCIISCDAKRLEPVFNNLIINAIQSMDNKGKVNIRLFDKDKNIILEFEDSGPGIPEDIIDKIFDPLFTTKQTGTGLGLVTCKKIIEAHDGTISVKNNPTIFTVTLPKRQNPIN